jgi:hypothetical protein
LQFAILCLARPARRVAGGLGKAALAHARSKTWRTFVSGLYARSVLECVRGSTALVLEWASWADQKIFIEHPH